jgi:16S rRNA (guanine1516-N2)-methyltransferase
MVSIGYSDEHLHAKALKLADELKLPLNENEYPQLFVTDERLELHIQGFSPLYVDFQDASILKKQFDGQKQGLIQAVKPKEGLSIIDATAGWGKDASMLAQFGANVLMIERSPVMAALLADGLIRLRDEDKRVAHLSLYHGDAHTYLSQLNPSEYPDVIYLDPMHPERQKKALVKKDMQALQQLLGADLDAESLLEIALLKAKQKVVLKWPKLGKTLLTPYHSYKGKTVRFDVYKPKVD